MASQDKMKKITDHGDRIPRSGRRSEHGASQVVIKRNPRTETDALKIDVAQIKIGTWNVRTMYQAGKTHNAIKEMKRLKIGIMGISEMRWPGSGECMVDNYRVYYSGKETNKHQHGVGMILDEHFSRFVNNYVPISERILLIQMNTTPIKLNILQVYAPTAEKEEEEVEEFYEEINKTLKTINKNEILITMGDFNAKIGKGREGEGVGPHGLGTRNERGDRLRVFAEEQELIILNTFFKLHPRRLYTWKAPADGPERIVRNQIDYILINKRFRNSCLAVKAYPGADIGSDHNPLMGKFRLKLKRIVKQSYSRWNLDKLKEENTKIQATKSLNQELQQVEEGEDIEREIDAFKKAMKATKEQHLKKEKTNQRKQWMTEHIMLLMERRRIVKQENRTEYNKIQREIRREIRQAKENWLNEKCEEIEELEKKFDNFNLHKKIKEAAGLYKKRPPNNLLDENGHWITDKQETIKKWQDYIEVLFKDERSDIQTSENVTGPSITEEEVRKAISLIKAGKTPGPDDTNGELLKLLDDRNTQRLTKIFNKIYSTGNIPKEWLESTFITIPKKVNPKKCNDYRTISLMSHLLKTFLKIMHRRLYALCEEHMGNTQFGFRKATGTREALFCTQVLIQRCRDVSCDVHICFIDYQKAFDRVKHQKLIKILRKIGIDDKDLRIIENLYWNQTARIKHKGEISKEIKIQRGVRQGCILSPLLFNLYSEEIFSQALENVSMGIQLNGERINNIRFADDTIIMAESWEDLQEMMNRVSNKSEEFGIDINIQKTKYMTICKNATPQRQLLINQKAIGKAEKYTYLGSTINDQWDHGLEIRCRIEKARNAFVKMSKLLKSRELNLKTRIRLLRCYVFSVLLYGVESWTVTEASSKKLEAFEMWLYRRMLRIPWTAHMTNREVLERMEKEKEIMNSVKRRKLEYLGHIMRNEKRYGLLQLILQGKVYGKRGPGRRRISWLKNLRTWFSTTTTGLFRATANKIMIARMIANIR